MRCLICGFKTSLLYKELCDDRYGAPGYFSVYRCNQCGFGRIDPVLKRVEIGNFYKRYYPLGQLTPSKVRKSVDHSSKFISWLFGTNATAHKHIKPGTEILDIGSGSGASLLEIKNMGAIGFGIEPDPSAQRIAKKLKLNVYKGFLTDNPFPKKKFDFVTASQVLEHEPDPFRFLLAAKRKLNKNGQIVLSFPNMDSYYRKLFGRKWLNWHIPYHINFFTKNTIERLAKKSNLKIVGFRTITPNIWTVLQIRNLFRKIREGVANPLWTVRSGILIKILNLFLFTVVTPINRFVDALGMGDSILVTLEI